MKTVTIELVVRTQVPDDTNLVHLSAGRSGVVIPLIEGKPVIEEGGVVGYPTHPVEHEHLTHQWRITEGEYRLGDAPTPMLQAPKPEAVQLHNDDWMMRRIIKALDAIRYSDQAGLETELDLIAFAEDVLAHYRPKEKP